VKGICQVSFTKVKDNTNRTIYCTLEKGLIPSRFDKSVDTIFSDPTADSDLLPIWDVAEGKWKSFRISKLVLFITSDELIKENAKAHSGASKIVEQMDEQKKKLLEDFRQRVADLKEKALQARNNINGVSNEDEA
jgi:hypothetical protein